MQQFHAVLDSVVPVFALILGGYLAARFRLVPEATARGLADFTFGIAMPALLFRTILTSPSLGTLALGIIAAFFAAVLMVWGLSSLVAHWWLRRPALDHAAIGMAASFGNAAMLGLPLAKTYFGDQVAAACAMILAVHSPIMWIVATLQHEVAQRGGEAVSRTVLAARAWEVVVDLAKNPIVAAVTLATLGHLAGLTLPSMADRTLALLAEAAVPGALFALGLSLTRFEVRTDAKALLAIVGLKLLVLPVLAYGLASWVLQLPPVGVAAVVLLAACPTGANAFLFASRVERVTGPVSGAIAAGTALSVVSITLLLLVLGRPE